MNRRELLKALPAVLATPFMFGKSKVNAYSLDPKATYIYFIDRSQIDIDTFCKPMPGRLLPPGEVFAVDDVDAAHDAARA